MGARIVDATRTTLTIEFSDTAERTETLETLLRPYGIREIGAHRRHRDRKGARSHAQGGEEREGFEKQIERQPRVLRINEAVSARGWKPHACDCPYNNCRQHRHRR